MSYQELAAEECAEGSAEIRARVDAARQIQRQRFSRAQIHCNAQMNRPDQSLLHCG